MQVLNVTKKSRFTLVLTIAGILGVASLSHAEAGVRDPGVNARQLNQRQRVQQGVRSGELTRRETGAHHAAIRFKMEVEAVSV